MRTTSYRYLIGLMLGLGLPLSGSAQEQSDKELAQCLQDLHCEIEYLPLEKSPDSRPVVRLKHLVIPSSKNKFVEERLNYITKHTVIRSLTFSVGKFDVLQEYLGKMPEVKEISTWRNITPEFLNQLKEIKKLECLHLPSAAFGKADGDDAAAEKVKQECFAVLGTMQQIRALDLSEIAFLKGEDLKPLAGLKNLEELNLSDNEDISDTGLKIVAGITSLKRLQLKSVGITDEGLAHLKALPKLEQLQLAPLTPIQKERFAKRKQPCPQLTGKGLKCLAHFTALRDLSIEEIDLDVDEGLSFLTHMPKLERLTLMDVSLRFVKDVAVARKAREPGERAVAYSDFSEFKKLKELRELRLGSTYCQEGAFKQMPTLDKLEILHVWAVFVDVDLLPEKMPNLKSLTMLREFISDPALPTLAKLKHLEYFGFNNRVLNQPSNLVTMDGLVALKKAKPNLIINPIEWQQPVGPFNEKLAELAKELKDDK